MLSIYVATSLSPQSNVLVILTNVAGEFTIPKNMQLKLYSSKLVKTAVLASSCSLTVVT